MRRIRLALLVLPAALLAAPQGAIQERTAPAPPRQEIPKDATDGRRAKAREMLESAGGQAGALPAEFQPLALLQLAVIETTVDKQKAGEHFDLAFAAAATLPSNKDRRYREDFQANIVEELAKYEPDHALELLRAMPPGAPDEPDSRAAAVEALFGRVMKDKKTDRAMELLGEFSARGMYPYRSARTLIETLPAEDERLAALYALTDASFRQRPEIEAYLEFIRELRKKYPSQMLEVAVRSLARAAEDKKGMRDPRTMTCSTAQGDVSLDDPWDVVYFMLVDLVAPYDADWIKRVGLGRSGLQAALERWPGGMKELENAPGDSTMAMMEWNGGQMTAEQQRHAREVAFEGLKFREVMIQMRKDPLKVLELQKDIPSPILRRRCVGMVIDAARGKEPDEARSILSRCESAVAGIPAAAVRPELWVAIAAVAHDKLKDDEYAMRMFEKAIGDAREAWKKENDADSGNAAPGGAWASTMAFRTIFRGLAKTLGEAAEGLLEKLPEAELNVLARLEIAGVLLDAPSVDGLIRNERRKQ